MRVLRILNILLIPALALASFTAVRPLRARAQSGSNTSQFVPGEVVIGFEPGLSAPVYSAQASALAADSSAQVAKQYGNLALLSFADGADVAALADQLGNHPGVRFAEPNYIYSIPEATLDRQDHTGQTTYVTRRVDPTTNIGQDHVLISTAAFQAMRTKQGTKLRKWRSCEMTISTPS